MSYFRGEHRLSATINKRPVSKLARVYLPPSLINIDRGTRKFGELISENSTAESREKAGRAAVKIGLCGEGRKAGW